MRLTLFAPLSIAALSCTLALPTFAQTYGTAPRGEHEAMRMVPAQAALERTIDADKEGAGYQFKAKLAQKVQLSNGPELPAGTELLGTIGKDDMNVNGNSKLVLRFTTAVMKNGQNIPIKATIVGIFGPQAGGDTGYPNTPGQQVPNTWNDGTLAVDQIGVMSGVDLHSKIASQNSGVLVSTKKNVHLAAGSEFELALAEQTPGQQQAMNQ